MYKDLTPFRVSIFTHGHAERTNKGTWERYGELKSIMLQSKLIYGIAL